MRNRRSEPTGLKPLQLLLVGQREEDYFIIQDLLNSHGSLITASLDHAAGFDDAKTRLTHKSYDLLLFEHGSEHDAVQIVREIRSRNQTVPCLFLTEQANEATITEIVRAGACECVSRSEIQASLVRAIRSSVSLSRSERQCRDQEDTLRKLHSAVEQSADIVLITNRAGIIEYVNPAFERVTGYTRAETVGQTPRILKSGEHGPEFYGELWSTIRSGQVFRNVVVNRKKSGESYIAEKVITPVCDAEGRVTHFISNDRDSSDRRRLEAALFQAQKMDAIGQLAAGVAPRLQQSADGHLQLRRTNAGIHRSRTSPASQSAGNLERRPTRRRLDAATAGFRPEADAVVASARPERNPARDFEHVGPRDR